MVPIRRETILNFLSGTGSDVPEDIVTLINELKAKEKYKIEQGCRITEVADETSKHWKLCETFHFRLDSVLKLKFIMKDSHPKITNIQLF